MIVVEGFRDQPFKSSRSIDFHIHDSWKYPCDTQLEKCVLRTLCELLLHDVISSYAHMLMKQYQYSSISRAFVTPCSEERSQCVQDVPVLFTYSLVSVQLMVPPHLIMEMHKHKKEMYRYRARYSMLSDFLYQVNMSKFCVLICYIWHNLFYLETKTRITNPLSST